MLELPELPAGYRWKVKPHGIHVRIYLQWQNSWKIWKTLRDELVLGYPIWKGEPQNLEDRVSEQATEMLAEYNRTQAQMRRSREIAERAKALVQGT